MDGISRGFTPPPCPHRAAPDPAPESVVGRLRGSTEKSLPEKALSSRTLAATSLPGNWQEQLLEAAGKGDIPAASALLELGADINAGHDDNHPIKAAIASGNVSLFQLLSGDTRLEIPKVAESLFLAAVAAGNVPVTAELLERGAKINTVGTGKDSAITSAAMNGHLNLVEFLLDKGADITAGRFGSGTPIREAALAGHLEVVQLLLARGANIEADCRGCWTPLSAAAEGGHYSVVEYLLDMGASVHADTYFQGNPIGIAARKGYLAIVKLLVKRSALIDAGSPPPLCFAVGAGQHDVVKYLCQQGVNVNNRGKGTLPICTAAIMGNLEIVQTLHRYGADLNAPAVVGQKGNALSAAWFRRHFLVAKYLMEHGADFPSANQRRDEEAGE